jgi:hypothetical protein
MESTTPLLYIANIFIVAIDTLPFFVVIIALPFLLMFISQKKLSFSMLQLIPSMLNLIPLSLDFLANKTDLDKRIKVAVRA